MIIKRTDRRPLKISTGAADRDPMFAPVWYVGAEALSSTASTWDLALLPPPDTQQNDHVMRYWDWRLDRMERRS